MKLWAGRFQKPTDELVNDFNASISFDQRLYKQDIAGSKAHAQMLSDCGILTKEDNEKIQAGLDGILADIEAGNVEFSADNEDIHMNIETLLTERIGDAGKRLHTARSRNDQVALDFRLYLRDEISSVVENLLQLEAVLCKKASEHQKTVMPGYTHLQRAQPITFAQHLLAYASMFTRDITRLEDCQKRMNECPLGSGALAGTTYPLDREYTAELLGFYGPTLNSMDGVSDRDYLIEFLSACATIMMHLSRFSEEIIIWNSNEYQFVEIDDAYSTGSSIMPQKKNPDIAELVRGKTGRVYGSLMALLTVMKGLPLAYNKDMQEDKEPIFDSIDTVKLCLPVFCDMIATMTVKKDNMLKGSKGGFTNATDVADYLVKKGLPFREAHAVVGRMVFYSIEHDKSLDDLTMDEFKEFSDIIEDDIYNAISMETCVNDGKVIGGPAKEVVEKAIADAKEFLAQQ